jgi:hypothetical protein
VQACGLATPRWSVVTCVVPSGSVQSVTASMATLPEPSAWVWVGPPLLASGPKLRAAEVTWVKPEHVPSVAKFVPWAVKVPPMLAQFPPDGLSAMMEFLIVTVPPLSL